MKKVGPVVALCRSQKRRHDHRDAAHARVTNTGSPAAVCIASCYLPDYYSSAPKAGGPQDESREPPAAP
jgi:hypothetical protein